MAAKFEKYIRSLTNMVEINNAKISTLHFKNLPSYDLWLEGILFGEYKGVNIPPAIQVLTSMDSQGVYAWVEDKNKITDLTDLIVAEIHKLDIVQYVKDPNYQFIKHNLVLASEITVEASSESNLKFSVNSNLLQLVLPFMTKNSYEPKDYKLYEKVFPIMDSYQTKFSNNDFIFDQKNYTLKKVSVASLKYMMPQFKVEFLEKRIRGNDLEIFFSIKGDRKISLDNNIKNSLLWLELIIQVGTSKITLVASNYYEDSDEFKFTLKNVDSITNTNVKIIATQMRLKEQSLALSNSDTIAKVFLPVEIVLFKKTTATTDIINAPILKSIQLWDGLAWHSLGQNVKLTKGSHLRFIFKSSESLRELNLFQEYTTLFELSTSLMNQKSTTHKLQKPNQRNIHFDETAMKQTIQNNTLYVDINIDQNLLTEYLSTTPILFENKFDGIGLPPNLITDTEQIKIDGNRKISDLSFVTQSGNSNSIILKNKITFIKTAEISQPVFNINKKIKCESLFN
ncbi:MAG: hypothetical protein WA160_01450 [Pseudobdellovibrio sp.]